jgi:hypothetical protein
MLWRWYGQTREVTIDSVTVGIEGEGDGRSGSPCPEDVSTLKSRRPSLRHALEHGTFALAPILVTAYVLVTVWAHDGRGEDFRLQYWRAGWSVLHGLSPYLQAHSAIGFRFPYPAFTALVFVPFALLPRAVSGDIFTVFCVAAPLLSLRILGVRDWRLYGLVLLLAPVVAGWQTSNLTLPLGLGMALLWRYRERPAAAGVLVAILASLKPMMWPVGLWLLVTRRWKAAAYAAAFGLIIQAVSWSVLGFDQIRTFLQLTGLISHTFRRAGYGTAAWLMNMGTSQRAATVVALLVAGAVFASCVYAGRRRDGEPALVLAVVLMFCASPLVWTHYFALLIVPLAIIRPRLSPVWAIPTAFWACPLGSPRAWECALALTTVGVVTALLIFGDPPHRPSFTPAERRWKRAIPTAAPKRSVPSIPSV